MDEENRAGFELEPEARKRVGGPRVVLVGALIIAAITAFVVWRIVETSGPGPDPRAIPSRPSADSL
jgi:hypothetical protein